MKPKYHNVLEPCSCKKKCYIINDQRRKIINEQFWHKSYERQGDWLIQVVKPVEVQRVRLRGERKMAKSV